MNGYDLQINTKSLDDIINKMSKNLDKLEEETKNINDAYLSLDESKWVGPDKTKIDSSLGIYLKNMTNFSLNLKNTLEVLKKGLSEYEDIEKQLENDIRELEDL